MPLLKHHTVPFYVFAFASCNKQKWTVYKTRQSFFLLTSTSNYWSAQSHQAMQRRHTSDPRTNHRREPVLFDLDSDATTQMMAVRLDEVSSRRRSEEAFLSDASDSSSIMCQCKKGSRGRCKSLFINAPFGAAMRRLWPHHISSWTYVYVFVSTTIYLLFPKVLLVQVS